MAVTIGRNIASLKTQRQLADASSRLGSVFERLSSGQRINRASDDAAGLSVASALEVQSRVFNQGIRNLNDGQSLLSIVDSSLQGLSDIVARLQELSAQAANGTYSARQRKALDKEAQVLSAEFSRIVQSTSFNGVGLLNGGLENGLALQAGFSESAILTTDVGGRIGTGAFSLSLTQVGIAPARAALGDVTGDGVVDLVASYGGTLALQRGNGDGTFASISTFSQSSAITDVQIADTNGDGRDDIITGNSAGVPTVTAYMNLGGGAFSAGATIGITAANNRNTLVRVGDINDDGRTDVVAVSSNASTNGVVAVALGNGDGTFASPIQTSFGTSIASSLELGDFNGDGKLDVFTGSNTSAFVMYGDGAGSFSGSVTVATGFNYSATSGDLNGDGNLDFIVSDPVSYIAAFLNNGSGSFTRSATFSAALNSSTATQRNIITQDVTNDGILDILNTGRNVGGGGDAVLNVFLGNGNGTFRSPTSLVVAATGADDYGHHLSVGDINGDGVDEVAIAGYYNGGPGFVSLVSPSTRTGVQVLKQFSLLNRDDAKRALDMFSRRTQDIARQRGVVGAYASRLDVAAANLVQGRDVRIEARARITSTDVASEAAELSKLKILQDTGAAILAQANLTPSLVLELLKV